MNSQTNWLGAMDETKAIHLWDKTLAYFSDPDTWLTFVFILIKVAAIYIIGKLLIRFSNRAIVHLVKEREKHPLKWDARRTATMGRLIRNIISYVVNFVVILMILSQFSVNLGPILAGAGVLGLAIGFGAQSLVKDVITGFFIIFEDQFAVGDVIKTGNFQGTVEEIGLRITRIRNWTGEVFIIPNGAITEVTNFSVNNSMGVVDVSIAYEADIDQAMKVIKETAMAVRATNDNMVKDPDVLGVQTLGAHEVVIRVVFECKPMTHFGVSRELNAKIKMNLDAHGIEIPYPKVVNLIRSEKGSEPHGA